MSQINKIQLKTSSILSVPLQKYPNDFSFIVNGQEFKTSQIISELLSPNISQIRLNDPAFDKYIINTQSQGDFSYILKLATFDEISIPENEIPFISEIIELLGNESINFEGIDNSTKITSDNIFTLISRHERCVKIHSKIYEKEIDFISSHFFELCESHKEDLLKLTTNSLTRVISNNKLQLNDEDQLLKFVDELYSQNKENSIFYEYIHFLNVTSDQIFEFITSFDMNDMTNGTWMSLCDRLKQKIVKDEKDESEMKRYTKNSEEQSKEKVDSNEMTFSVPSNDQFSGIFNHLKNKSSNIENEVNFTASSLNSSSDNEQPRNVVLYENKRKSFFSGNLENSWICFEFKNHQVNPTNYTIRTVSWGVSGQHPRNWVIEGSNDNSNWQVLDEERECSHLKGNDRVHTFSIKNKTSSYFKYIRMRQIGPNWANDYVNHLVFDAFEIYGKLK